MALADVGVINVQVRGWVDRRWGQILRGRL